MKKRDLTYCIFKAVAITLSIPIILLWLLIILLYIPPLQSYAVEQICHKVKEVAGFETKIGTFHLSFPLELNIADFNISKNDTILAKGEHADVNISFLPLLSGEVEVNYVSFENISLNTANLIQGININGDIGFFRTVARNINLKNEIINLRQLHLHSANVNIALGDLPEDKNESAPLPWILKIHNSNIENCNVSLSMPNETITSSIEIGKMRLREGFIDLSNDIYSIKDFDINSTGVTYDKGNEERHREPLNHLKFSNIDFACSNAEYTPDSSKVKIEQLSLAQPGGMRITETSALLYADRDKLDIKEFIIKSKNGSYINLTTVLPWNSLHDSSNREMSADVSVALNKRDLYAILSRQQLEAIDIFNDNIFNSTFKINGNVSHMNVDTFIVSLPEIAKIEAKGDVKNLTETKAIEADFVIGCIADNLHKFINPDKIDSLQNVEAIINGNIAYNSGEAKADLNIEGFNGAIDTGIMYNINNNKYKADIDFSTIDLTTILQDIPLTKLTAKLNAEGEGFNLFAEETKYNVSFNVDTVQYKDTQLNGIKLEARQNKKLSQITLSSSEEYLEFKIKAETELDSNLIRNKTNIDISEADFMVLGLTDAELGTRIKLDIESSTDMQESHTIKMDGKEISIITQNKTYTPEDITFDFSTTPDSSFIMAKNGDLYIQGAMETGYNGLFNSFEQIKKKFNEAVKEEQTLYYIHDYAKELPDISLDFSCGENNILHNFLLMQDFNVDKIKLGASINDTKGINISSGIYGFKTGELNLDTIRFFTKQEGNKIRYLAGVRSTATDPQQEKLTFSSVLYGNIFNDSVTTNFILRDRGENIGVKFGLKTLVRPKEIDIHFKPNAIFFNNKFNFSNDNYIKLGSNGTITGDVILSNNDAGMHLYSTPDEDAKLNANLELFNINLKELTSTIPFVPEIAGTLNLDLYLKKSKNDMMLSSDIRIDSIAYNGTHIGNEIIEVVYFPKDEKTHYLDVMLSHNDDEVLHINGDYLNDHTGHGLHGGISLTRFPLSVSKVITKNSGLGLNGYINGELKAKGKLSELSTDGFLQFDSVYINAPLFGTDLHLSDKIVNIKENRISFKNFNIFARGENPFKINGYVDLSKLSNPAFNLRMNAVDYELINAPRTRGSMLYGKMFIDLRAFIGGTLNNMKVYGDATLLGKSNTTFVMLDAPISTDKELDGLVEFVNFQDTIDVKENQEEADFGNMNISLGLKIEDGAKINADLDANRSSYVMLQGGGNLNMSYTSDNGLNVTGTYTMHEGELKYELPIIPLKTFNITDGSKVTWSGDISDPTIDITALERITTSVNIDDNGMQPVAFDVGVRLSNTLSDIGLTFTISAPDNALVQEQLNNLDAETLNKYAITMLITGTYIGNTKGMTVSNALSSFLDAKINDLTGSAMKSVSVNVGINDAENSETGGTYKNYSFSFRKRFLNDRLTIVIGGEVNSGDHPATNDSFINNVSLEWKISDKSNRYIRLFYDKNYKSLLEGEIIETGVGYVYKKKIQSLRELFTFKKRVNKKRAQKEKDTITEKRQKEKGK